MTTPDLVIVGAASRDLAAGDARGWRLGGAASYCSLTAARLGLRVGCLVGVDEAAARALELDLLREAGVAVQRVELTRGPVFDNIETDGHRRQRWLSASDPVPVSALPEEWRDAAAWLFGPVAGEVPVEWAGVPGPGSRVAVGWQGLLRCFAPGGWVERIPPAPSVLLERAGLVIVSADDLDPATDLAALCVLAPDATIVITAGEGGGVALGPLGGEGRGDGQAKVPISRYPAIKASRVADPTGAGDVFMAALMAAWLGTGDLASARALRFAAAAGSRAVEGHGLGGVPTMAAVKTRLLDGRTRRG